MPFPQRRRPVRRAARTLPLRRCGKREDTPGTEDLPCRHHARARGHDRHPRRKTPRRTQRPSPRLRGDGRSVDARVPAYILAECARSIRYPTPFSPANVVVNGGMVIACAPFMGIYYPYSPRRRRIRKAAVVGEYGRDALLRRGPRRAAVGCGGGFGHREAVGAEEFLIPGGGSFDEAVVAAHPVVFEPAGGRGDGTAA